MASGFTGRASGFFGRVEHGSRIAGYLIEEQIGSGGMAVVFRARDEVLGRLAAVKIIAPAAADDQEFRARFLRESRMAAAVDSPHIIPVYGAGEADGLLYIATRFVPGGDLEALRRRSGGVVAPARVGALVAQVALALDAAHAAGLVHRDVKPQNILVDTVPERAEHAFLSDFGLSKGTSSTGLTATGQFVGTPDYCAPEQIRSTGVDGRADQYALGCVAFVLLTGKIPFRRADAMATLYAHVHDPAPALTGLCPELPPAANDVVARALAKSPADRYATCGEFAEALTQALLPPRTPTAPVSRPWPSGGDEPWPSGDVRPARQPTGSFALSPPVSHASAITEGNDGTGSTWEPLIGGRGRPPRRRPGVRSAVIAGTAAVILAAAGTVYGISLAGNSHARASVSSPSPPKRPGKPILTATLAVPDGGHVSQAWFSQDGRFIAAVDSLQPRVYVWNTVSHHHVTTLTVPPIKIGNSPYPEFVNNIAFSANDTSLTMSLTGTNKDAPQGATPNVIYEWNLATGKSRTTGSITSVTGTAPEASTQVLFSGDNTEAVLVDDGSGVIRPGILDPAMSGEPPVKLPGTGPVPESGSLNYNGSELLYPAGSNLNYLWDFATGKVVAQLSYQGIRPLLSPDGSTVMEYPTPKAAGLPFANAPVLWDVATRTNITPTDPRWRQQGNFLGMSAEYSTDGSVIETFRSGGKIDLWDVATHKYLMTIAETNFKVTGVLTGPGGSEVAILGGDHSRQVSLWETPLSPPKA